MHQLLLYLWVVGSVPTIVAAVHTIHVLPHSHNDPGWHQTFKQYHSTLTSRILRSTVDSLGKHPDRRMVWSEICFLHRWWELDASEAERAGLLRAIRAGQLELVGGGWVMNDEACPLLGDMLLQFTLGHGFVSRELNVSVPQTSWAIDPFGHSPAHMAMLQHLGMRRTVINRLHYRLKQRLREQRQLDFDWNGMAVHVLPFKLYDIEHSCGPDRAVCNQYDFARLKTGKIPVTDLNIADRAEVLVGQLRALVNLSSSSSTHVLMALGDDFRYGSEASHNLMFDSWSRLMAWINTHYEGELVMQYDTLTPYFDAILGDHGVQGLPTEPADKWATWMQHYADEPGAYWTGYYASRPHVKRLVRMLHRALRSSLIDSSSGTEHQHKCLQLLALAQHHDTVTGTSRASVTKEEIVELQACIDKLSVVEKRHDDDGECIILGNDLLFARDGVVLIENPSFTPCPGYAAITSTAECQLGVSSRQDDIAVRLPTPIPPLSSITIRIERKTCTASHRTVGGVAAHQALAARLSYWKYTPEPGDAYLLQAQAEKEASWSLLSEATTVEHWTGPLFSESMYRPRSSQQQQQYLRMRTWHDQVDKGIEVEHGFDLSTSSSENMDLVVRLQASKAAAEPPLLQVDINGWMQHDPTQWPNSSADATVLGSEIYPVPSTVWYAPAEAQLVVSHSTGVRVSREGAWMDVLMDRRCRGDFRGMGEGVTDNVPTILTMYVLPVVSQPLSPIHPLVLGRQYPVRQWRTASRLPILTFDAERGEVHLESLASELPFIGEQQQRVVMFRLITSSEPVEGTLAFPRFEEGGDCGRRGLLYRTSANFLGHRRASPFRLQLEPWTIASFVYIVPQDESNSNCIGGRNHAEGLAVSAAPRHMWFVIVMMWALVAGALYYYFLTRKLRRTCRPSAASEAAVHSI